MSASTATAPSGSPSGPRSGDVEHMRGTIWPAASGRENSI
jgi:hypothetical protein